MLRSRIVPLVTAIAVLTLLGACGRSTQRPATIEGRSGADTLSTFTYEGSNLVELEYEVEGDRRETWEFTWEGGQLAEILIDYDNGGETTHTFTWEGGQLKSKVIENGDTETTVEYGYEGGVLTSVVAETRVNGDRVSDSDAELTYEGGRIVASRSDSSYDLGPLSFDTTADTEYSYDDQGRLEDVVVDLSGDADGRTRTDFEYNDQGRLELIEREGRDYDLSYDDMGRVEEIDDEDGPRYEIVYDNGTSSGLVFDLYYVPYGGLFDLEGKGFTEYSTSSLSFLLSGGF